MISKFVPGQKAFYQGLPAVIQKVDPSGTEPRCYIGWGDMSLPLWVPEKELQTIAGAGPQPYFNKRPPALLSVDGFYRDPDAVRRLALMQDYGKSEKHYKGVRTKERFLFPYLREEFERIIGHKIVDWLNQPANGVFQCTGYNDPLVWHSDLQDYAAAIYLTPEAPINAGTSFWRDRTHGCRRPPMHRYERPRFKDDATAEKAYKDVYNEYNYVHEDNWELVDQIGSAYNRLLIWDAQLIHSASSYTAFTTDEVKPEKMRLVQLFFFTIQL